MKIEENSSTSFDKERFLLIANGLFEEAFLVNCYLDLLEQINSNAEIYCEEMKYSAAFYKYAGLALITSITMELAKIYETNGQTVSINRLLNLFCRNTDKFPSKVPIMHKFTKGEIELLHGKNVPWALRVLAEEAAMRRHFNDPVPFMAPIELSLSDWAQLNRLKLDGLSPVIKNLSKQRNKIYAHNDDETSFDYKGIQDSFPVSYDGIRKLASFATEVSQRMIACCTNVVHAEKPINIQCLDTTLKLVRIGIKYQAQYMMDEMPCS